MNKIIYSTKFRSTFAYVCPQGCVHDVNNHEVSIEDDHVNEVLERFSDTLSTEPWENINNEWVRSTKDKTSVVESITKETITEESSEEVSK